MKLMSMKNEVTFIEAEQYSIGSEDGFMTIGEAITCGLHSDSFVQPTCAKFKGIPFLKTLKGYHFISDGDYITVGVEGERYPLLRFRIPKIKSLNVYRQAEKETDRHDSKTGRI